MIRAKSSNLFVLFLCFLLSSNVLMSQTQEDLEFLNLLPNNQAMSIAEKLGVQTGKPISDEVVICLLYTSPSPRDTILSRMPSSA